jgi:two-component system, NtrC family, response regulator
MNSKILIIDDEPQIRILLEKILSLEGFEVATAENASSALEILKTRNFEIVITDVKLPDANGIKLTKEIKSTNPDTEIIVLTAYGQIKDGVEAMKNGAFDYIVKGGDGEDVLLSVNKAAEKIALQNQVKNLKHRIDNNLSIENIITKSDAVKQALDYAGKVAVTDSAVLLQGETGTGKELFAHLIHNISARSDKAFIAINCSAIPKDLQESELFGYVKGAFTGAVKDKKGFFEEASGGTLFLDEAGDMSPDTQAKLLRFLETGSFVKVGDTKEQNLNVRIISATNKDLKAETESGNFRKDLYYRLNSFIITLPPLRERLEDIEGLSYFFLKRSEKLKKNITGISEDFLDALKKYLWPGNIRELKNVIERAMILSESKILTPNLLPKEFSSGGSKLGLNSSLSLEELEKEYILRIYKETGKNKTQTAKKLGISSATLYRKLKDYGID